MAVIPPIRILSYPNFRIYSPLGKPASRFPSCLLRSDLLSILLKVDPISEWCRLLKITSLYAILSGFPADAERLLPLMQRIDLSNQNPFWLIFRLYRTRFLDASIRRGLIDPRHLSLAGDGTPHIWIRHSM